MTASVLFALVGVGLAVGFVAGLIGIGGGVLIVPFLYFFYEHPGWSGSAVPPDLEAAVAHATSLFIIVPTAFRGVVSFHRAGRVVWRTVLPVAGTAVVSAIAGARLALVLPGELLKLTFGVLLLGAAWRVVRSVVGAAPRPARQTMVRALFAGVLVGLLSGMLGVGGGLIAIPLLIQVVGLPLEQVPATSLAVVAFASLAGTLTYIVSGWGVSGLPLGSLGYVHVAAAIPMLVGSLLSVRWGAAASQRLPAGGLRWVFALLLAGMGVRLILENAASAL